MMATQLNWSVPIGSPLSSRCPGFALLASGFISATANPIVEIVAAKIERVLIAVAHVGPLAIAQDQPCNHEIDALVSQSHISMAIPGCVQELG
jgi:hypothetical protein